tara:strand:+ start:533 stop:808 length:276 start_codon:yes stop_codon:yes gene_type:complete
MVMVAMVVLALMLFLIGQVLHLQVIVDSTLLVVEVVQMIMVLQELLRQVVVVMVLILQLDLQEQPTLEVEEVEEVIPLAQEPQLVVQAVVE